MKGKWRKLVRFTQGKGSGKDRGKLESVCLMEEANLSISRQLFPCGVVDIELPHCVYLFSRKAKSLDEVVILQCCQHFTMLSNSFRLKTTRNENNRKTLDRSKHTYLYKAYFLAVSWLPLRELWLIYWGPFPLGFLHTEAAPPLIFTNPIISLSM